MSRNIVLNTRIACGKCEALVKETKEKITLARYNELKKTEPNNIWSTLTEDGPVYSYYRQVDSCRQC